MLKMEKILISILTLFIIVFLFSGCDYETDSSANNDSAETQIIDDENNDYSVLTKEALNNGYYWRNRRHECTNLENVKHTCTRLVKVKKSYYYSKLVRKKRRHPKWYQSKYYYVWKWVKGTYDAYEFRTFKNSINCGGLNLIAHKKWITRSVANCGKEGWPHQEYLYGIDPKFHWSDIKEDTSFNTQTRGKGYCYNSWATWENGNGFHGTNGNKWYGDYVCSHAPFYLAYCGDMKAISYVMKTDGTIEKCKDLTRDLVKEYGLGAKRIHLWMGDYGGFWGTGAEICLYELVDDPDAEYLVDGVKHSPTAHWQPCVEGTRMEFIVVDKLNNRRILSTSRNTPDNVKKTWWLNVWADPHPRRIKAEDLIMYFRVKEFWGYKWKKWIGSKPHSSISDAI